MRTARISGNVGFAGIIASLIQPIRFGGILGTRTDSVSVDEFAAATPCAEVLPADELRRRLEDPSFHDRQRCFVSRGPAGTCAVVARLSPVLKTDDGKAVGHLGFFEADDDEEAARGALQNAASWLLDAGAGMIVGPLDSDTWHRYRLNVGPWERPRFAMEPWNPPFHGQLWEAAGFLPVEEYTSKWIDDVSTILPALAAGVERAESRGYRLRSLDPGRTGDELDRIHELSLAIFERNLFYSPISREEFRRLYQGVERMLDPALVLFAVDPAGADCGFLFAWADTAAGAVHYKTIGVAREHRLSGVAAALAHEAYSNALAKGMRAGNHALMREGNASQGMDAGRGEVFRRYRLYRWSDR